MQLYDYQSRAIGDLYASMRRGCKRNLVVSPTGSGKGVIIVHLLMKAAAQGRRALFFAHRRELVTEIYDRLEREGFGDMGTILADDPRRRVNAVVQLGSTDSLAGKLLPPADLVIQDEAHRALNASSSALFNAYPDAQWAGFTGTPIRLDRRPLSAMFDHLIVAATMSELFAKGRIVRPRVYTIDLKDLPDLSGLTLTHGDYNLKQLSALFAKKPLVGHIVRHWLARAEGRQTIVSATSLHHAAMIAAEFRLAGVAAETIDGTMGTEQRKDILDRFRALDFPVLVQCELLIEGIDIPDVKCIVMARRTMSLTLYLQLIGRSVRPSGDQTVVVLDHAGNTHIHGAPDMDRDWEDIFYNGPKRKRAATTNECPVRVCPGCFRTINAGCKTCPHEDCRHVVVPAAGLPTTVEGTLVEVPQSSPDSRLEYWKRQCGQAHKRGLDYAWVAAKYREKWNEEPDRAWDLGPRPVIVYTPAMKREASARLHAIAHKNGYGHAWIAAAYAREVGEPMTGRLEAARAGTLLLPGLTR